MHHRYIGDKAFYRRVFGVAVPIIIQNGITNFVSLLDNIMVGQVGTVPMSGVSIVNGLLFVFNLCVFGASSGAGIFTAQFYGSKDDDGIRHTFRFKFLICIVISLVGAAIFLLGGSSLIGLYLTGEGDAATAAGALDHGLKYLAIMLWGFLPFALTNTYSSTLRETGETFIPMLGGIAAVFVNLVLNYILIFGKFGAPEMGVRGAAVATIISQAVSAAWVLRFLTGKQTVLRLKRAYFRIDRPVLASAVGLGASPFVMQSTESLLTIAFNVSLQKYGGDAAVGAMTILTSVAQMVQLPLTGLAQGAQPILIEAECPERAEDEAMAVRRLGFYARCGAKDTGWTEHLFDAWFRVLVLPCCGGKVRSPEEAVRQLADCYRRTMGEPQWRRNVTFYRPDGVEVQF